MKTPLLSNSRPLGLIACLAALSLCQTPMAMDFHVAPNGNDMNPGTKREPFATLPAARDAARARGGAGRVIPLAPGRYFHAAAISLDDRDRGLPIKGEQPGAIAEIYGGLAVNGWTMSEGPFKSAAESYVNKGHRIESNFIYDCSKLVGGGGGMQIYQSGGNFSLPMMPATT